MTTERKQHREGTIGVFDSGIGGLTILEHLTRVLPNYDFDYLGDTGRAPYGSRSRSSIAHFTDQGVNFLFRQGAVLVIIACNTSSAVALHYLQTKYLRGPRVNDRKILGIVIPTAEEVARVAQGKEVVVLGTAATIASKAYQQELAKVRSDLSVAGVACPLFVPIVEEGWEETDVARLVCERYLGALADGHADTLVLACTHYPFLRKQIAQCVPSSVRIVEQGPVVAERTVDYLQRHPEIEGRLGQNSRRRFFVSDSPERFVKSGSRYFGSEIKDVVRVTEAARPDGDTTGALMIGGDGAFELETPFAWQGRKEA